MAFVLLISSFPSAGWAQMGARSIPSGGGFQPSGATFASGLDFYRWMSSFPEFSRNPAFLAQVLIQAAPLIQKGPVKASLEGNRIVLVPDRSDSKPLYIELPGGPVSQSAALLARELQRAQEADEKEGGVSHSSRVLSRFFESFSRPAPESGALPVKASVSEDYSPAPQTSRQDIWLSLERWIGENLDLKLQPGKTNDWTREAAEILRNQPAHPLNKALAESFVKIRRLSQEQGREVELLLEKKLVLEQRDLGYLHQIAEIGGKLYAGTNESLYFLDGKRWKAAPQHPFSVNEMIEHEGRLHVASNIGLIRESKTSGKRKDKWKKDPALAGIVYGISQIDGKLYAATMEGIYSKEEAGWRPADEPSRINHAFQVLKIGGKLHVASYDGLYVQEGDSWKREDPLIYRIIPLDGKLYVVANNGIYVREEGKPPRHILSVPKAPFGLNWGAVHHVSKVDGKIYGAAEGGIYLLEEGEPRLVLDSEKKHVYGIFPIHGKVYVGIGSDLWRWVSLPKDLPESWQDLVLKDIGSEMSKVRQIQGISGSSPERLPSDKEGRILGEDGRTIFSGFKRGANVLLAILGAGALEGLSRLAITLGNLSLGFGAVEDKGQKAGEPGRGLWKDLESKIQKALELQIRPGRLEEWKEEAVELLRNNPGWTLERALAKAFAKVRLLSPEAAGDLEALLGAGLLKKEVSGIGSVSSFTYWDGKFYLGASTGLYVWKKGRPPERLFPEEIEEAWEVASVGGKLEIIGENRRRNVHEGRHTYAFTLDGAGPSAGLKARKFKEIFPFDLIGNFWAIGYLNGRLHVGKGPHDALYIQDPGGSGWKKHPAPPDYNDHDPWLFYLDGILHASNPGGLFQLRREGWALADKSLKYVKIAELEGKRYMLKEDELYVSDGMDWIRVIGPNRTGWIKALDSVSGKIYLATLGGLWSYQRLEGLPSDWKGKVLGEIGQKMERDRRSRKEAASKAEPFSADSKGNLLGEDGRTLFSGFQKTGSLVLGILGAGALEGLSRLALSLGNLSLGFGSSVEQESGNPDPWAALERQLRESLDLKIRPGRTEEWKKEAAEILRNDPGLSLENALARGLAQVHFLAPQEVLAAESLLRHGGSIFWKIPDIGIVRRFVFLDGKFYLATSRGLYEWQKGGRPEPALESVEVFDVAVIGGKLHAFAGDAFYVREGGNWEKKDYALPLRVGAERPRNVRYLNGKLHAAVDAGAYVHIYVSGPIQSLAGSWERLPGLPGLAQIRAHHDLFYLDGKLHESSNLGEFALEGDRWNSVYSRESLTDPSLNYAADIGGRRYATGFGGFYVREADRWKLLFNATGNFTHFAKVNGHIYLGGADGLWQYEKALFDSHMDWKAKVLEEIAQRMERDRQSRNEHDSKAGPFSTDEKGNILGEDGRALFSGLQKGMRLLLGLAGAGILEGLGRLALSFGNLSLGFGMEAEGGPDGSEADPWAAWDRWIRKDLGMASRPKRMREWKRETAEILRDHPGMPLEKALAEAFSRVNVLKSDAAQAVRSLVLRGGLVLRLPLDVNINDIAEINGNLYVAEEAGLYVVQEGVHGREKPISGTNVHQIAQIDGQLYAATDMGLYLKRGNEWKLDSKLKGGVRQVVKIDGQLYAGTHDGIYLHRKGSWGRLAGLDKPAYEILKLGGRLYARTNLGFYAQEEDVFVPMGLHMGASYVAEIDGEIYASITEGVYIREGSGWKRMSGIGHSVYQIAKVDGKLYAAADDGLYRLGKIRWEVIPGTENKDFAQIAKINGRFYAAGYRRLYVKQKDGWAPLPALQDLAERDGGGILIAKGKIYVNTGSGIWQWFFQPEGLSEGWKERMLKDISRNIERIRQDRRIKEKPAVSEPLKTDDRGNILGSDGRTVFSGFKRGANVFLAALGAGALEGLSRLAVSLGNLSLGFGKEAGEPESSEADVWRALEGRILYSPRAGWNLRPGRLEKWKEATAEILRNNPGLALTRALAKAFAKVYSPPEPVIGPGGLALSELGALSPVIKELYGRLYAATDDALYVKKGKEWSLALDRPVRRLLSSDGRVYAIGKREVYMEKGGVFKPVIQTAKPIEMYFLSRGKLYLGTSNRAYAVKDGRPGPELVGFMRWLWAFKGKAYAVTDKGVYEEKEGRWERVLKGNFWELIESEKGSYALGSKVYLFQEKTGWKMIWDEKDADFLFQKAAVINDRLHMITQKDLLDYRLIVEKDDQGPETVFTSKSLIRDFWRINGRLYVRTDGGLYWQRQGRWEHKEGFVEQAFELDGKVYALINRYLYAESGGRWESVGNVEGPVKRMDALRLGEKTYVIAQEGPALIGRPAGQDLYVLDEKGGWTRVLEKHDRIRLVRIEEETYAMTDRGLYAEKGGQWTNVLPKEGTIYQAGMVYQAVRIDGRVYAASDHGLYAKREGRWIPVVEGLSVRRVTKLKGVLYLESDRGIFKTNLMLENWEKPLLEDLTPLIERMQKENQSREGSAPSEIRPDEKGNILGEDGRSLFSGFHKGISLFLGILGAGALEGLSRLALSIGGVSLGFGKPARAGSGERSPGSALWSSLEGWVGKSLGLRSPPGRAEDWKKETAELLRSNPGLSLEEALAGGFARVRALDAKKRAQMERLLKEEVFSLPKDRRWTRADRIFELEGKLHVATDNGIYRKEPRRWKPVFKGLGFKKWMDEFEGDKIKLIARFVSQLVRIGSHWYGATDQGLFVRKGKDWDMILGNETHGMVGTVYQAAEIEGALYAAAGKGLYSFKNGEWNPELMDAGEVYQVIRFQGALYAATASGLYVLKRRKGEKEKWEKEEIDNPGWFHSLAEIGGVLYAASQRGLYLNRGKGWKLVLEDAGAVQQVLAVGGRIYAAAEKGLYIGEKGRWRRALEGAGRVGGLVYWDGAIYFTAGGLMGRSEIWRLVPAPEELPVEWKKLVLKDIGREIERAQKAHEKKDPGSGPISSDEKGNIVGEDGRTIFGGE